MNMKEYGGRHAGVRGLFNHCDSRWNSVHVSNEAFERCILEASVLHSYVAAVWPKADVNLSPTAPPTFRAGERVLGCGRYASEHAIPTTRIYTDNTGDSSDHSIVRFLPPVDSLIKAANERIIVLCTSLLIQFQKTKQNRHSCTHAH